MIARLRALKYPLMLIPGFLLWAAFPPMGESADVYFALAVLLLIGRRCESRASAKVWLLNGLFFWLLTLSWFPAIIKNDGPAPLVFLGWLGLSGYCAIYFGLYGWLTGKYWTWQRGQSGREAIISRAIGIILVEPVLWCGLELVRSRLLGGFSWNQLGVASVNAGFGSPAAWGGVYLISATVILVNGTLAGIAERMYAAYRRVSMSRWRSLETFVPVLLVLLLYEFAPKVSEEDAGAAKPLRVALIQRNFPCCFSGEWEDPIRMYRELLAHVEPLAPDLVILPESAMAEFGALDSPRAIAAAEWLMEKSGADELIAGGSRSVNSNQYNSAAIYRKGMRPSAADFYDKVHLVPFGEFIPGDKTFPILQRFAPVGTCYAGEPKLLNGFGTAICYEDTDSALIRRYARMGAKALVFITNDSWFSHSVEAEQHAWQARARAIETGLMVMRVGNSGVTGTVSPSGAANWFSDRRGRPITDRGASIVENVSLPDGEVVMTAYTRWGDLPLACIFTITTVGILVMTRPPRRQKFGIITDISNEQPKEMEI